jgi:hypothetical protein
MEEYFGQYLISLITQLPMIIVYIVGLILAIARRQRHPKASLFAILGTTILLLNLVVMSGVQLWFPRFWVEHTHAQWRINSLLYAIGFLRSFLSATGFALLLLAVLTERPAPIQSRS